LQLWIIAAAGLLEGVGPAMVEDVLPCEWVFSYIGRSPTAVSPSSRRTWRGDHPVRRVADPDCSMARKNAWSRNGLACGSLAATKAFQTFASIFDVPSTIVAVSVSGTVGQEPLEDNLVGMLPRRLGIGADLIVQAVTGLPRARKNRTAGRSSETLRQETKSKRVHGQ